MRLVAYSRRRQILRNFIAILAIKFRNSARSKDENVKLNDDRADARLVVNHPRNRLVEENGRKVNVALGQGGLLSKA